MDKKEHTQQNKRQRAQGRQEQGLVVSSLLYFALEVLSFFPREERREKGLLFLLLFFQVEATKQILSCALVVFG